MLALTLALSSSVAAASAPVYPVSPEPLHRLCEDADLVLQARVVRVEEVPRREDGRSEFWSHVAWLEPEIVLLGEPESLPVRVRFNPHIICPSPAVYVEGARVLAFLSREENGPGYVTRNASYGVKELEDDVLRTYVERIQEYARLSSPTLPVLGLEARLRDWMVDLAVDPVTRWDGAAGLLDRPPDSPPPGVDPRPCYWEGLSRGQRERLRSALLATDWPSATGDRSLVWVVGRFDTVTVRGYARARLERARGDASIDDIETISFLMKSAVELEDAPEAMALFERFKERRARISNSQDAQRHALCRALIDELVGPFLEAADR